MSAADAGVACAAAAAAVGGAAAAVTAAAAAAAVYETRCALLYCIHVSLLLS